MELESAGQAATFAPQLHDVAFSDRKLSGTRSWYAVYTAPQHEKSVTRHLQMREVDFFLPTYERERVWKNRQRVKVTLPLFSCYLFVHIDGKERRKVVSTPGVISILGSADGATAIPCETIEFLRSDFCRSRIEPYRDLIVGQRVRIKNGPMRHITGTLIRKKKDLRFVVSIEMINQHAALEICADDLAPAAE